MHKDIEKILYSEKDIENIVNTIAKQIEKDYNDKDFILNIITSLIGRSAQGQRCLYG